MAKVKLGDVAKEYKETCQDSKKGFPIIGLEHLIPEEINLTIWDEDKENTFTKMFRKGHMLFGRRRAYLKKAALAPFDGICSGDITVIEAIQKKLLPELLPFIIQNDSLFNFAIGKSAGSLSPRVKWEHLKDYEFNLPNLTEQKRIAEVLWTASATRAAYKKLLSLTDDLVKAQFTEMFGNEYELDKWDCNLIEDVAQITVGVVIKPAQYYTQEPNGIKAFRSLNVGEMRVRDEEWVFFTPEGHKENSKSILRTGDVLVVRSGYPGTSCVVTEGYDGCNAIDVIIARPDMSMINPVFLSAFTNFPHGKNQIVAKTSGAAQQHFNVGAYKAMTIPLPPLELQSEFETFFWQAEKSKTKLKQAILSLETTLKSFMKQFIG